MTRNGKIARMPYDIREELNRKLRDGKSGAALLKWLNEHPECGDVLDEEFEGRAITKQNLSEWKQGGYKDWVRKEETRERVHVLMEKADDLERDAGRATIGDRVATLLEAELAVAMEQLDEIKDAKERWARVKEITRELHRLRREDHHARKLRMAEEQYKRQEKEAEKEKLLKLYSALKNKPTTASIDGNTDEAWQWADWVIRVAHGLPMPEWWTNPKTAEDWEELLMPYWLSKLPKKPASPESEAKGRGSRVEGANSPKSKVQGPKSSNCGVRNAECGIGKGGSEPERASRKKSDAVRPGPTASGQKSGAVRPGPGESKSFGKAESRNEKTEIKLQAPGTPMPPNGSESVEARATEFDPPSSDYDATSNENGENSGGNAT